MSGLFSPFQENPPAEIALRVTKIPPSSIYHATAGSIPGTRKSKTLAGSSLNTVGGREGVEGGGLVPFYLVPKWYG